MGEKDTSYFIVRSKVANNRPVIEIECKTCKTTSSYDLFDTPNDFTHQCPTCGKQIQFDNEIPDGIRKFKESIKQQIRDAFNNK